MNFVSLPQLERDVTEWAKTLPRYAVIAGIEESGMLPARILARCRRKKAVRFSEAAGGSGDGVLVVDDSINFGGAMTRARQSARAPGFRFAAVYASGEAMARLVDHHCRIVPQPRFFEWNFLKHDLLAEACFDLDGLLCEDCGPESNDDGRIYARFIEHARPRLIPTEPIAAVVTGRLEKYRRETREWLDRHGVRYGRLAMMPFERPEERRAYGIARFKAETYAAGKYRLFAESDAAQAEQIAAASKKPVLCVPEKDEWRLL